MPPTDPNACLHSRLIIPIQPGQEHDECLRNLPVKHRFLPQGITCHRFIYLFIFAPTFDLCSSQPLHFLIPCSLFLPEGWIPRINNLGQKYASRDNLINAEKMTYIKKKKLSCCFAMNTINSSHFPWCVLHRA